MGLPWSPHGPGKQLFQPGGAQLTSHLTAKGRDHHPLPEMIHLSLLASTSTACYSLHSLPLGMWIRSHVLTLPWSDITCCLMEITPIRVLTHIHDGNCQCVYVTIELIDTLPNSKGPVHFLITPEWSTSLDNGKVGLGPLNWAFWQHPSPLQVVKFSVIFLSYCRWPLHLCSSTYCVFIQAEVNKDDLATLHRMRAMNTVEMHNQLTIQMDLQVIVAIFNDICLLALGLIFSLLPLSIWKCLCIVSTVLRKSIRISKLRLFRTLIGCPWDLSGLSNECKVTFNVSWDLVCLTMMKRNWVRILPCNTPLVMLNYPDWYPSVHRFLLEILQRTFITLDTFWKSSILAEEENIILLFKVLNSFLSQLTSQWNNYRKCP